MTPLMIPRRKYDSPVKTPWQDLYRTRPGFRGKVGIGGVLDQPARYIADRAYRYYDPERRAKHLYWYGRRKYLGKYVKYWHYKYQNYAKISKKRYAKNGVYAGYVILSH